jgi:predicted O-methyltransferase YrrM
MRRLRALAHELAKTGRFWLKTARSSFFRRRPTDLARFLYTRHVLSRHSFKTRYEFLPSLGIDPDVALRGIERWRPVFDRILSQKTVAGITKNDGWVLYAVTRALRPDYVIETGVADGVSTCFFAAALIDNGHGTLYSIELPPEQVRAQPLAEDGSVYTWPEKGVAHLVPKEMAEALQGRWHLVLDDVRNALHSLLSRVPHVDVFFHDDLHTPDHQLWEYDLVWPKVRPGGVLISDDATYAWLEFVKKQGIPVDPRANFKRMTAARKAAAPT